MSGQIAFIEFRDSVAVSPTPPAGLSLALQALWYDQKGQWETAHSLAQESDGRYSAWVHAYLHRKEGDEANAGYWYRLAGQPIASCSLAEEWDQIVRVLLTASKPDL